MVLGPAPERFGDQVTGDSLIDRSAVDDGDEYFPAATNAFVLYDRATGWVECFPKATLSYNDTLKAMRDFQGTTGPKVQQFHSDNFPSIAKAAKTMRWTAPTSTPGIPQTNGLAERKVRQVKEGGRTNLVQSGLDNAWWPYAVAHRCVRLRGRFGLQQDRPR